MPCWLFVEHGVRSCPPACNLSRVFWALLLFQASSWRARTHSLRCLWFSAGKKNPSAYKMSFIHLKSSHGLDDMLFVVSSIWLSMLIFSAKLALLLYRLIHIAALFIHAEQVTKLICLICAKEDGDIVRKKWMKLLLKKCITPKHSTGPGLLFWNAVSVNIMDFVYVWIRWNMRQAEIISCEEQNV